jgi:hypothetical protein
MWQKNYEHRTCSLWKDDFRKAYLLKNIPNRWQPQSAMVGQRLNPGIGLTATDRGFPPKRED